MGEKKYLVKFNKSDCIGVFACTAVMPDFWKVEPEGVASLEGAKEVEPGMFELEIEEEHLKDMIESAQVCPVNVIEVIDKETGEKLN